MVSCYNLGGVWVSLECWRCGGGGGVAAVAVVEMVL